jgi:cell cycle sensor histidine kinase DivJ
LHQYLSLFRNHPDGNSCADNDEEHPRHYLETKSVLRQIAGIGSDFVIIAQRTGEVDDCSFSTPEFRGLKSEDLLAGGFLERVHVADRPACLGALNRACHDGEKINIELRLRCLSSEHASECFCWIEMTCSAFQTVKNSETDEAGSVLCVSRDITYWKEREQELIARERAAQEAIETKSRFLSNMSHELRTPLNAIIGFSEMMKLPGITEQNEQQMVEYAGIIHDSGRHLLGVVNDVFDMSQLEVGKYKLDPQIFRVADLVSTGVDLVQLEAENKGVRFVVGDFDHALQMSADWRVCRQALVELLAGYLKCEPESGRVHLAIRSDADLLELIVTGSPFDGGAELPRFSVGAQLQGFVDLLHGCLHVTTNATGQNEVTLRLQRGLPVDVELSSVVPIDNLADRGSQRFKLTA